MTTAPSPVFLDRGHPDIEPPPMTGTEAASVVDVIRNPAVPVQLRAQLLKFATGSKVRATNLEVFVEALTRPRPDEATS